MIQTVRNVALLATALALGACGAPAPDAPSVDVGSGNRVRPGETRDLVQSFATSLACDPSLLTWSIQESSNPGFISPRDGAISAGAFTAPICGSIYVGTVMHVQATGCGRTGVASIAIAQEQLGDVVIAYALVGPGTPGACLARDPTSAPVPIGGTVQFYARLSFTCQVVYVPALPATWPALCP